MVDSEKYYCEYCGRGWGSPVDKAKCVLACAAKMKAEDEKRKKDILDYVNSLWDKACDAKKMAENAEREMKKKYPELKSKGNINYKEATNTNKFHVSLNGENIRDEKIAQEIIDRLKQSHYIPSFMSINEPLGIWTY